MNNILIDLTGQRFGKLTVIKQWTANKYRKTRWLCKCDCGKEHIAIADNLKGGNTKSCGCYKNTFRILPKDLASFNAFYSQYVYNARNRKIFFRLNKDEFRSIASKACEYCGSEPVSHYATNRYTAKFAEAVPCFINGIDRVDNSKGYEIQNCVSCCGLCNYMKRSISVEEFLNHVKKIHFNSENRLSGL